MYRVEIEAVTNGYIVTVGCRRVVFNTRSKMLTEIDRYLKDPKKVENEYVRKGKEFMPDYDGREETVQEQAGGLKGVEDRCKI